MDTSPEALEYGIVSRYDETRREGHLFVQSDDKVKKLVYFHLCKGLEITIDENALVFRRRPSRGYPPLDPPSPGDEVVFNRLSAERGDKTNSWAYAADYKAALAEIERRRRA